MKIIVLGASGVVGQHMMLSAPQGVEVIFCRRKDAFAYVGIDLSNDDAVESFLNYNQPDVVVNLAGENQVDVVEKNPAQYEYINALLPETLSAWATQNDKHLIQVSTQGVFSGENAPYSPRDLPNPITEYGKQKAEAEFLVQLHSNWTIARLTFVLGLRPWNMGRTNPLEAMFTTSEQLQVNDRFFSPVFAKDAAKQLWSLIAKQPREQIYHIGVPITTSRYEIAIQAMQGLGEGFGYKVLGVSHNHFPGIAPRPRDTTWASGSLYSMSMSDGIRDVVRSWVDNGRTKS